MISGLTEAIRQHEVVLFVGAGVSQNLGLPSFGQLVRHLAEELGYDPDLFASQGDYLEPVPKERVLAAA